MTSRPLLTSLAAVSTIVALTAACGSSDKTDEGANGGPSDGKVGAGAFVDTNAANPSAVDPKSACATSSAAGEGIPPVLVFMFDRSGSMDRDSKWPACTSALKTFFADQSTQGLSASLQFFPLYNGNDLVCEDSVYKAPEVPVTALPEPTKFSAIIDKTKFAETTPTLPALKGAIGHAQELQASGKKAVVVLVTDGEPNNCGSGVDTVTEAAAQAAATVKTYVIGVGNSLDKLNKVAAAGGTGKAILISTSTNAGQIAADFKAALGNVASQAMSCDYNIPAPPTGQSIDPNKVNVQFTPSGGSGNTLSYSKDCAAAGWRYDNPAAPSRILLCPSTCDTVMKDKGSKINVFFGCAVQGDLPR